MLAAMPVMSDALTPREKQFIENSAKQMAKSLEATPFTSPVQAMLYGGGIGALAAIVMGKDVIQYALYGSAGSALVASVSRFWFMTGWECGFCTAVCNDPRDKR